MENIIDYVRKNLNTFDMEGFNSVDSLVLSAATYFRLPKEFARERCSINNLDKSISFRDLLMAEHMDELCGRLWDPEKSQELLFALAASPRFRDLKIIGYESRIDKGAEMQFAAVTLVSCNIENPFAYIGFRGTDSTFVGWKEDFNMAFQCPVPAQERGARYAMILGDYLLSNYDGISIYLGGHSKGGNVAVYSAAMATSYKEELELAIKRIFSHDGPGFIDEFLSSKEYENIADRVEKTVPQSSVFGMIMENQESYRVVKSSGFSFWQHDYFTWYVGEEDFVTVKSLSKGAEVFDKGISTFLQEYSYEEREEFIDLLYDVLRKTNAQTTKEFKANLTDNLPQVLRGIAALPESKRRLILKTLGALAKSGLGMGGPRS